LVRLSQQAGQLKGWNFPFGQREPSAKPEKLAIPGWRGYAALHQACLCDLFFCSSILLEGPLRTVAARSNEQPRDGCPT